MGKEFIDLILIKYIGEFKPGIIRFYKIFLKILVFKKAYLIYSLVCSIFLRYNKGFKSYIHSI